jgi:hypothetical protein
MCRGKQLVKLNYSALCYILKSLPFIHSRILNSVQQIPIARLGTKHFVLASELCQPLNFHTETVAVLDVGVWYLPIMYKVIIPCGSSIKRNARNEIP